ncbi:MAG: nucleotidyltransferase [Deltaproteobacteria bacterium]|nr:nucleotidyltransferase [Deltaproteobacteria bacterium]
MKKGGIMYDCSSEIMDFYRKHVRLSAAQVSKLADYREANKGRVETGLKKNENPLPLRHINQGSYAMRTINQHPRNDYDIDVGVVFGKADLQGPQGGDKTAFEARKMVCDAVQDSHFKTPSEVRQNCVRVYYNEGHHVDMPVYRQFEDDWDETKIELAGNDWIESDPEAVTNWFNNAVIDQSPDETNGRQMRRIVRLLKFWAKSRDSWNMPTGFIISKLVDECYISTKDRDDRALYETIEKIKERLFWSKDVQHPVLENTLISEGKEASVNEMETRLEQALNNLSVLHDAQCTRQTALKAWKGFFNHSFFSDLLENSAAMAITIADKEPREPVRKRGGSRFG